MTKTRSHTPLSRRDWLRASGAAALVLPFLRLERAEAAGAPKRFVIFCTPNGIEHLRTLPPSLERIRADLLVVDGVDWKAAAQDTLITVNDDHGKGVKGAFAAHLTPDARAAGPSLDQHLAAKLAPGTPFATVEHGVFSYNWGTDRINFGAGGAPIPMQSHPRKAFDRLFGAVAAPMTSGPSGPSSMDLLRARRKSVLDHVVAELQRVRDEMTASERAKFEGHLDSLRAIERRLGGTAPMGGPGMAGPLTDCGAMTLGSLSQRITDAKVPDWNADPAVLFDTVAKLQTELTVLALACGLTRIATLRFDGAVGNVRHSWLGASQGHHDLAHAGASGLDGMKAITRSYSDRFAGFVDQLRAIPDGAGTLLDNSLVLWGSDMADGNHGFRNALYVLAGKAGGALMPGRTVQAAGRSQNDLFVSVCRAMGADTATFGNPATCTGPLPQI